MEIALLVITSLSLITNLLLVNHLMGAETKSKAETIDLPVPSRLLDEIREWQDAAEEVRPAAVTETSENPVEVVYSPWKNVSGIQQSVSAPPAPPIVKEQLPPLARPAGFV
jgi:hypothetical protein